MERKIKILILLVALGFLNFAFMLGQIFYYNQEIAGITARTAKPSGDLTANLLKAVDRNFVLTIDNKELAVDSKDVKKWIESYSRDYGNQQGYRISEKNIKSYLNSLSDGINIPPLDAKLKMDNGKILEFSPSQAGRILDVPKTLANIVSVLSRNAPSKDGTIRSTVIMDDVQPEVTLDKVNNLGINKLLGHGDSNFAGSPAARVNNIHVSSQIFNGILLKPGEEFSFINLLGKVDATGGYQPELVIKKNVIIPEYGGGICQVSTTLFRAVVAAGLPVLERHPHSLPVRYYNPQGFDATVYPGAADLRFKNDTPAYILIQSEIKNSKISFEIYGTDDGRKVSLEGPRQYDIKPDGSMKAELLRTVIASDGTKKEDVFDSSYQSPSLFPTVRNPLE